MNDQFTWIKIRNKHILIVNMQFLTAQEKINTYNKIADAINFSGMLGITIILNVSEFDESDTIMRAVNACLYRIQGFVDKVVIIEASNYQSGFTKRYGNLSNSIQIIQADNMNQAQSVAL